MATLPTGSPLSPPLPAPPQSTFSLGLFPLLIPTVIKRRLTRSSSRYALIRANSTPAASSTTMPLLFSTTSNSSTAPSTGDSTPRPSSSGSASTARNSDDSLSGPDDDLGGTGLSATVQTGSTGRDSRDILALPVNAGASFEGDSGVRWNRVNPALHLLRDAGYEAQQPHSEPRLVRSLYLNSMAYLLSALPEDLSPDETALLRSSMPEPLKPPLTLLSPTDPNHPQHQHQLQQSPAHPGPAHRSYLHRLLASSIIYICLLLQLLMPYLKEVMFQLYRYDRAHRITERITALILLLAEKLGRGGVGLGNTVLNLYDGKTGAAVNGAAAWWMEGVAGGIYEGLGEGLVILGFGVDLSQKQGGGEIERGSG
ncbi:uncharacterized protein BDV14DRAFT_42690 [Aspergillus stella-maris]|uniref:uncharacterized protein n=1 Tax=Aspergillus stella-maris TaxID=1810926 RepID=UPI003CCE021D